MDAKYNIQLVEVKFHIERTRALLYFDVEIHNNKYYWRV